MDDRRKVQRLRALKGGRVAINGAACIDCRVRNMSAAGACLEVVSQLGIPDDFNLMVTSDLARQGCHVVWRSDSRLGVQFTSC
ncbi:MAG TPA: PilZ domain-containing protein [Pseudolabrys sp.]|nr:PilZ domain-containing protein [Pseudolabrys sp.]